MTVRTPHVVKEDKHWLNPPEWWKKFRPLRWLAVATIIGGLGSGIWGAKEIVQALRDHPQTELYLAVEPGVALGSGFTSYSGVEAVVEKFDKDGVAWTQNRFHRPPSESYPPRNLDTVKADRFTHLGEPGKLSLEFFNNRLLSVSFEPENAGAYSRALFKSEPRLKKARQGRTEFSDGNLRLSTNVDLADSDVGITLRTTPFAIWQDLRLVRQAQQWDADFGSIPVPRKK